jgi:hypothetical protein
MPTHRALPRRLLPLLLAATFAATGLAPGLAAAAPPDGGRGRWVAPIRAGCGRTGLRLPAYVPATSVAALLTAPPRTVERHHPAVPGALTAAGKARAKAAPVARPAEPRAPWSSRGRQRVATATGAVVAVLAALALAIHRLRQRT